MGQASKSRQASLFDEVGEEPLEISTSMTPHTAAVLGECFQFLGSCLYGLDL